MDLELLKRLVRAPGVTGFEGDAGKVMAEELQKCVDEVNVDSLGNVIGRKFGASDVKVLLDAHLDEIGLIVKSIGDKGFIKFDKVGGIASRSLPMQPVTIHGRLGPVQGIIGCKTELGLPEAERDKVFKIEDLFIDVGASSKEDVEKLGVGIGDPITIDRDFKLLGGGKVVVSRAFDDRVGCFIIIEALKKLKDEKLPATIYVSASVQEEMTGHGARVAAYGLNPHVAIAVDVTLTGDVPGLEGLEVKLGGGPAVTIKDGAQVTHPKIRKLLMDTAKEAKIPYQIEVCPIGGTDALDIQPTREGIPSGILSIPCRYIHNYEAVHLEDVENAIKLLALALKKIDKSFIEGKVAW